MVKEGAYLTDLATHVHLSLGDMKTPSAAVLSFLRVLAMVMSKVGETASRSTRVLVPQALLLCGQPTVAISCLALVATELVVMAFWALANIWRPLLLLLVKDVA